MTLNAQQLTTSIALGKAIPELTLTGSYCFGNTTGGSDIDFFAYATDSNREKLKELGFKLGVEAESYKDTNTAYVYYLAGIHVQLVKEYATKVCAQTFLLALPTPLLLAFLDEAKSQKKLIWDWAYQIVLRLKAPEVELEA